MPDRTVRELFEDALNGNLVRPDDISGMAESVNRLIEDRQYASGMLCMPVTAMVALPRKPSSTSGRRC